LGEAVNLGEVEANFGLDSGLEGWMLQPTVSGRIYSGPQMVMC